MDREGSGFNENDCWKMQCGEVNWETKFKTESPSQSEQYASVFVPHFLSLCLSVFLSFSAILCLFLSVSHILSEHCISNFSNLNLCPKERRRQCENRVNPKPNLPISNKTQTKRISSRHLNTTFKYGEKKVHYQYPKYPFAVDSVEFPPPPNLPFPKTLANDIFYQPCRFCSLYNRSIWQSSFFFLGDSSIFKEERERERERERYRNCV